MSWEAEKEIIWNHIQNLEDKIKVLKGLVDLYHEETAKNIIDIQKLGDFFDTETNLNNSKFNQFETEIYELAQRLGPTAGMILEINGKRYKLVEE